MTGRLVKFAIAAAVAVTIVYGITLLFKTGGAPEKPACVEVDNGFSVCS